MNQTIPQGIWSRAWSSTWVLKGTGLQQKVNRAGWTSQLLARWAMPNVFVQLMFRDSFVLWIDRNDRASRTRSSYAWCCQLLSWVKCWQVQPMHPRVSKSDVIVMFYSCPILQYSQIMMRLQTVWPKLVMSSLAQDLLASGIHSHDSTGLNFRLVVPNWQNASEVSPCFCEDWWWQ